MCPTEHGIINSADPCRHPTVYSRKLGDAASHSSLFMCSRIVDRGTRSSDDRFRVDFIGERSMEAATAAQVSKRVVFLPLRGLSLTLPRANARFSHSSSVDLRGGSLLNRSRNAAITWDMVCPLCCLLCIHTCHQALFDRVTACVSHTETQRNSVATAKHVCTILQTVAKLPCYIVLRAALCCVNLY